MAKSVIDCDLVVIGSGGAGMTAAVKAKHLGVKKVILLEAGVKTGGCTWYCGWGCSNTKWHKDAGYPDTTDGMFRQTMKRYNWNVDRKLIRNFVDSQGPMFDWFDGLCNVSDFFTKPTPYVKPAENQSAGPGGPGGGGQGGFGMGGGMIGEPEKFFINTKSMDPSIGPGRSGSYLVVKMREQCEKLGVQVITGARARHLIQDKAGNITGVTAETKDGTLQVNSKACVLAAGGFGHNMEKCRKRWPELFTDNHIHNFNVPWNQGDSFDMAEESGVLVDYLTMNLEFLGPVHHPYSFTIFKVCLYNPEVVYVNLNGERYFDETFVMNGPGLNSLIKQPKGQAFVIMDDELVDIVNKRYMDANTGREVMPFRDNGLRREIEYEVSLDEAGARGHHSKRANTFEELAKKMQIDPQKFVATMNRYNEYCAKGRDLEMYKDPKYLRPIKKAPFYAFWVQNFTNTTHNGIIINGNMETLRAATKEPIRNLFAAGDAATAMDGGGTWAVVSGYMSGVAAAKYLGV